MRSISWLRCAAILGGLWFNLAPASGQENFRFPPMDREVWLVAHEQPIQPPPDVESPSHSDSVPPGPRPPWLIEDPAKGAFPTCPTQDEALQSPNCGCEDIQYGCCPPQWLVRAEAIVWDRAGLRSQVLGNAGGTALNMTALDPGWEAGPRLTLQKQNLLGTLWGLELVYFQIDGYQAAGTLTDATSIATVPPINIAGANTTNFLFSSRIYNAEANLRRGLTDRLTFLHGFRWLQFSENLNTDIQVGGVSTATHNVNVDNHLYGYQIGADYRLWTPNTRWFVDAFGKAGIYGNWADQTTTTAGVGGALPAISANTSQVAFVGEAGIYGGYRINDRWRAISGYNVLWLSGVADAPGQLATTNVATGAATVAMNGSPFYHGATFGLEWVR